MSKKLTAYTRTEVLFELASNHFFSAQCLFNSSQPYSYFSAAFLLHLSLELFLKGCIRVYKTEFCKTHDLNTLGKELANVSNQNIDLLTEELTYFQKFHNERYNLAENSILYRDLDDCSRLIKMIGNHTSEKVSDAFKNFWKPEKYVQSRDGYEYAWCNYESTDVENLITKPLLM